MTGAEMSNKPRNYKASQLIILSNTFLVILFVITGCNGSGNGEKPPVVEKSMIKEEIQQPEKTQKTPIPIPEPPEPGSQEEQAVVDNEQEEPKPKTYPAAVENSEPVILRNDDFMEIADTHYVFSNSITLEDNAKLVIRNSLFEHRQEHAFQHSLEAHGNSQVVFKDSELKTSCTGSLNWNFFGNSSFAAENITMPGCNTWNLITDNATADINGWDHFGATTCDNAITTIENSKDMEIELCYGEGAVLDTELPVLIDEFFFPPAGSESIASKITIRNSTIDGWGVGVQPNSRITVRNTPRVTISVIIGWPLVDKTVVLDDLQRKHYDNKSWEIAGGMLRLVNTTTYGWEPNVFGHGNTLIVKNSNFSGATLNSGTSKQIIENSFLDGVRSSESVEIEVKSSTIRGDVIASDNSKITIRKSRIEKPRFGNDPSPFGNIIAKGESRIFLVSTEYEGDLREEDGGLIFVDGKRIR